ncbi:phosphotransferase [Paenibacillus sp. GCM10027626]|uniref:phosphotransferase n=1 Tax=Paenibacillus sp. GCM10027626 TaxID=3273411 RepID=UPI00362C2AF4
MILENHTQIPFENKMKQICACIGALLEQEPAALDSVTCDPLGYKTPNFTTAGLFKLHGSVMLKDQSHHSWSIIVKIIKAHSHEKNDCQHHNYWRREAQLLESGLLDCLPESIQAPACYLIEEQPDGTVWLWMEHITGQHPHSLEQFTFIAGQLGRFGGSYLTGERPLPDQDWICRAWLRSWTTASRMYAPNPQAYISRISKENEQSIWTWYQALLHQLDAIIHSLGQLPRVTAHQDLSQMNMLLVNNDATTERLILIDWQFMSISGIGEDLGKLYGVNMSQGIIPPGQYEQFEAALFDAYVKGLRDMGWQGDECLARYGYCMSTAARSVWEVPKFFALSAQLEEEPHNKELKGQIEQLEQIISVHQKMDSDALFLVKEG